MRRAAACGAALLLFLVLAGGRGPLAAGRPAAPAAAPWWRTSFPPAALAGAEPLPAARVAAKPVTGLLCGSLDDARLEDGGVYLFGWAYDPATGAPATAVVVLDGGRRPAPPVHVFRERPDVAAAKGDRRLAASGWALWLPPHRVTAGRHAFAAHALLPGGRLCRLAGEPAVVKPERAGAR
jgi:hypothetical protein